MLISELHTCLFNDSNFGICTRIKSERNIKINKVIEKNIVRNLDLGWRIYINNNKYINRTFSNVQRIDYSNKG